ncbi:hypothetical protein NL676_039300 [Syzygium grande]|nr:hypothetical protein NL676_039300 [Syzygium grande]
MKILQQRETIQGKQEFIQEDHEGKENTKEPKKEVSSDQSLSSDEEDDRASGGTSENSNLKSQRLWWTREENLWRGCRGEYGELSHRKPRPPVTGVGRNQQNSGG